MTRIGVSLLAGLPLAAGLALAQGPMSSNPSPPAAMPPAAPASGSGAFDVPRLFANTCGWCHANAGRTAGKGPQLMGTALTDEQIVNRIRNGKPGAMPAFGSTFTDAQLAAIIAYIRSLKPEGS